MNLEFLQTRVLARLPLEVQSKPSKLPIYSPILRDVAKIGIDEYQEYIRLCILGKEHLLELGDESVKDYNVLLSYLIKSSQEVKEGEVSTIDRFLMALEFFTKQEFQIGEGTDSIVFYSENFVLNEDNYNDFRTMIKIANCIEVEQKEDNMDEYDKIAAQIEKEMRDADSSGESIPFKDLVSSVANMSNNNLNIINIWDLNIYTFYEQLKRGQKFESFMLGFKQLLAGAEQKDVKLEHYMTKI